MKVLNPSEEILKTFQKVKKLETAQTQKAFIAVLLFWALRTLTFKWMGQRERIVGKGKNITFFPSEEWEVQGLCYWDSGSDPSTNTHTHTITVSQLFSEV